ncbi:STAS/SEC14 domain-containing protein [Aquimarina sp. MMG016]|uniref:STAS/SEC14 domain-containing protein n=1 Tax=Aquimarina sp. MMG016 TaxID=2822690 RepID=UPI001B39FCC3|nr:STAS/SEC14 domain-containing protein [Aquimarina sp. MMG016]MBQ4819382.1 STAS/SEC14 domain-containing protein [Aquimarina sp. MMG016]
MPNPINEEDVVKVYNLEMGKVIFHKDYMIIEVAEGFCFSHEKAKELSVFTNLHFGDRSFGYISHRVNSYSVKPIDYRKIKDVFPNMEAFAVVTYNELQKESVKIENIFFYEDIKMFDQLDDAVNWVKKRLR